MKFSFIIPTLEEEKVLEKLLRNLKEINQVDYEIIVSDGGSKDQTVEIAKRYTDKVVENHTGERQTIGQGRNAGAAAAAGDFVIFLDADVYIPNINGFVRRAAMRFKNDPKLVGLSGWVRVFPELETFADIFGYVILSDCMFYISNNILHVGSTCGEFQMVKTEIFKKVEGFREHFTVAEDKDLFNRIAKLGHTRTDPKLLIYHTGRRPRAIGWPKLLWEWAWNFFHYAAFDKSHAEEWKVIR